MRPIDSATSYSCTRGESHLSNRSVTTLTRLGVGRPPEPTSHYPAWRPEAGIWLPSQPMAGTVRARVGEAFLELGARILQLLERVITRSSLVPTTTFLSPDHFPWAAELEASW